MSEVLCARHLSFFSCFESHQLYRPHEYMARGYILSLNKCINQSWATCFPFLLTIFSLFFSSLLSRPFFLFITHHPTSDAAHLPLVFAPESGNMLGGTVVNITGPCFDTNERVSCRFDTEEVIGHVVDRNRAICVQPFLKAQGYVRFEISIGTERYKWRGKFFVGKLPYFCFVSINRIDEI